MGCLWAHYYWEGGLTLESVVQRGVCLALVLLSGKVPLKPLGLGVAALLGLRVLMLRSSQVKLPCRHPLPKCI